MSENVMIVDLLRNDLSKIAKIGTVKVDRLFEVETHLTIHQMTSTISAILDENVNLYNIFKAIFPCGSITGHQKFQQLKLLRNWNKMNVVFIVVQSV
ncbi:MAG: chorismate-binding protein [Candidatus Melainabacteria bacterium]|nr:MAG: chorismate-binding protein [Candidatus Melainabacteria bacterium]